MSGGGSDFHIITGGPGSGKTSVIDALRARGHACVDEVGRKIIQEQLAIGGNAVHDGDRATFLELMLSRSIGDYEGARAKAGPVFFDRGIPELVGYCRLVGIPVLDHVRYAARLYRYAPEVFVAPPWEAIYVNDAERKQSFAESVSTHEAVVWSCTEAGYAIVELPKVTVEERMAFILNRVGVAPAA